MLGMRTQSGFWSGMARAWLYTSIMTLSMWFILDACAWVTMKPYAIVFFLIAGASMWFILWVGTMMVLSLSSIHHVLMWSRKDMDAVALNCAVAGLFSAVIGMGHTMSMFMSFSPPVTIAAAVFVLLMIVSSSAVINSRAHYWHHGARGTDLEVETQNWAQSALRSFVSTIMPRAAGDFSRFRFQPLVVGMTTLAVLCVCTPFYLGLAWSDVLDMEYFSSVVAWTFVLFVLAWMVIVSAVRFIAERNRAHSTLDFTPMPTYVASSEE